MWAVAVISPQFLETEPSAAVGIRSLAQVVDGALTALEISVGRLCSGSLRSCLRPNSGTRDRARPGTGMPSLIYPLPFCLVGFTPGRWCFINSGFGKGKKANMHVVRKGKEESLFILAPSPVLSLGSTSSK